MPLEETGIPCSVYACPNGFIQVHNNATVPPGEKVFTIEPPAYSIKLRFNQSQLKNLNIMTISVCGMNIVLFLKSEALHVMKCLKYPNNYCVFLKTNQQCKSGVLKLIFGTDNHTRKIGNILRDFSIIPTFQAYFSVSKYPDIPIIHILIIRFDAMFILNPKITQENPIILTEIFRIIPTMSINNFL